MRLIVVGAAGAIFLGSIGAAAAATTRAGDAAIVGPVLSVTAAGSQVGLGTVPSLVLGVVSTAIAPLAKQDPQAAAAIASAAGQVTAALAKGGAPLYSALVDTRSRSAALAPVVNPVANPVLDAVAAQLSAQAANAAGTPLGVVLSGLVPYAKVLKGSSPG